MSNTHDIPCQGGCGKLRSVLSSDSPKDWLCNDCRMTREPHEFTDDLAEVLERLLSQLSLSPMNPYVKDAYIQANNVLDEFNQSVDAQDVQLKNSI